MVGFGEWYRVRESSEELKSSCEVELQKIISAYVSSVRAGEPDESMYARLDANLKRCIGTYMRAWARSPSHQSVIDTEALSNDVLATIWRQLPAMAAAGTVDMERVVGLVRTMVERRAIDALRRERAARGPSRVMDVRGTRDEPASLADDPSMEYGEEDLLRVPGLTDQEKEVLRDRARGVANVDTARRLGVKPPRATGIFNDAAKKVRQWYGLSRWRGKHGHSA